MKLRDYFNKTQGIGVLATANAEVNVNMAIYARPHFLDKNDETTIAFIMGDRLSHDNVRVNPIAAYLFIEHDEDYQGKRLSLTRVKEETDQEKIQEISRRGLPVDCGDTKIKYLVYFRIDAVRPLIGAGPETE
jgi:hypothetical protein